MSNTYKTQTAAERDGWVFERRGEEYVASRYSGLTRIHVTGSTAEKVLKKINSRAAHRASMGVTNEPSIPILRTLS